MLIHNTHAYIIQETKLSMLCVCVVDVMDVVFSACIMRHEAVGTRVWEV